MPRELAWTMTKRNQKKKIGSERTTERNFKGKPKSLKDQKFT